MIQYIDKAAVIAEIKKRINRNDEKAASYSSNSEHDYLYRVEENVYKSLLSFINTLETKDVNLDLEITLWANAIPEIQLNDIERLAKYFYKLGIKAKGE